MMENSETRSKTKESHTHSPSKDTMKKSSRFLSFVKTLIVIIIIIVLGWFSYELYCLKQATIKNHQAVNRLITQQQQSMQNQFDQLSAVLDQQQNQVTKLSGQVSQALEAESTNDNVWRIKETLYLARLANYQLTIQHNPTTALSLLRQAQGLSAKIDDPRMDSFQVALSKDVTALEAVPVIDVIGLSQQLSALAEQVPNLSILVAPKPNTEVLKQTEHQKTKKWWQRAWDNIKASMQQLVVVRHQQELPALMSPDQQIYLQENLQLLLMQAQWGLINHNAAVYQESLKQAKKWVEKYYVQNSASTQDFLKQLEALLSNNISPTVPDLSHTLALVDQE